MARTTSGLRQKVPCADYKVRTLMRRVDARPAAQVDADAELATQLRARLLHGVSDVSLARRSDRRSTMPVALLEHLPLVDGHNDLPYVIWAGPAKGDVAAYDPGRVHQDHDTDIPRMREGGVSAQFWAAFIPTDIAPSRPQRDGAGRHHHPADGTLSRHVPARAPARADIARAKSARQDRVLHRHRGRRRAWRTASRRCACGTPPGRG